MIDQPNVAGIYFANLNLFECRSNISEPVGAFTGMAGKGVDEQVLVGDVDEVGSCIHFLRWQAIVAICTFFISSLLHIC